MNFIAIALDNHTVYLEEIYTKIIQNLAEIQTKFRGKTIETHTQYRW